MNYFRCGRCNRYEVEHTVFDSNCTGFNESNEENFNITTGDQTKECGLDAQNRGDIHSLRPLVAETNKFIEGYS